MLTVIALTLTVLALVGVALTALRLRTLPRDRSRNGDDGFLAWDWPPRPIDGHDDPGPPELEREPAT